MSERIGRHCDELRIKLHGIDRRLEALKANGAATFDRSQHAIESQRDRVEQRIYDNRVTVEVANARVKTWLADKKAGFDAGRALWKKHREVHLLEARADDAEAYAVAVFELAAAAADEAALASLLALLARNDADIAAFPGIHTSA
jgi:superfamily II RNA helicase